MKDRNTEIQEAIEAGNRALDALDEAMGHLKTARGLGVWDMLGGGFLSSLLKHSKMDDAQQAMQYAQQELQDFSRELADVQMYVDVQVNFDGLTRFVDMFCDSFFVDWMVQDRINHAKDQVEDAIRRTEYIVNQLQQM